MHWKVWFHLFDSVTGVKFALDFTGEYRNEIWSTANTMADKLGWVVDHVERSE